jgi:hypothetical protein
MRASTAKVLLLAPNSLRACFMPEDEKSYIYEAEVK